MEDTSTFAYRLRTRRAAAGLSQRALADASGVTQPMIAALERGSRLPSHATRAAIESALRPRPSALLRTRRNDVLRALERAGVSDARVFGSIARGRDTPDSDIDVLVTFPETASIVALLSLEEELANVLTVPVDLVSSRGSGAVVERALTEAAPL